MMRGSRGIPGSLLVVLIAAATYCAAADRKVRAASDRNSARPSVLLITLDTVRADHLACYGYSRIQTPNIDRLAAEGVRFTNAYTQVPITLPSHAVILTGTYPMYNGVRDFTSTGLPSNIPTLAEVLRRNGYHTTAFVSSFVLNSMWGLDRGFEVYDDDMGPEVGHSEQLFLVQRRGDRTVGRMLSWLNGNGGSPFFVWLHLYDAHSPYRSPEPYRSRYSDRPYDGAIAFDDAQVGQVLARLRETGRYDNTLIVLTSDHGESLAQHGEAEHGFFIYNATLRVPLVVKLPGQSITARVFSQPVSTIDIASAVASVCRLTPAESSGFQGRSFLAGLTGSAPGPTGKPEASPPSEAAYAESYYSRDSFGWHELRAVVTTDYEYIEAPRPELYDLHVDPGERSNIIAAHSAIASSLHNRLAEFVKQFTARDRPTSAKPADPETVEKLRSLGYVAYRGDAKGKGQAADPKDKIGVLNRILRADDFTRLGKYSEADQILDQLQQEEPALDVVHFERGENYLAWGKPESALEEFRQTLSRNPTFDQAALGLGRAYFLLGQNDSAATSFELALRLNPRNFLARLALAKVYWRQHVPDRARSELAQVAESHPQFAEGHADYGEVLAELRRYKEALAEIQRGIDLGFRDAMAYNYLGTAYANTGEPDQAIQAYETAIKLNPNYAVAYLNLAFQYLKQRQPSKADAYYQKVCTLSDELCRQYASVFSVPAP
ncbi:MAG: sulfatase-like hydrolase/transferase [Terriglobia bacterium]